jgi:hypothetical protein
VEISLAARRRKRLSRLRGDADEVADAGYVEDDEVRTRAPDRAGQMSDHVPLAAREKRRLRA